MARHRDLHARILSLLALRPCPMTRDELAQQLSIQSWEAHKALTALHVCGALTRTRGEPAGGRPQFLWSLPGAKPISSELQALLRLFPLDTVVVTPSNREARIVKVDHEGFATLAYLDGDVAGPDIRLTLLRAFQPGRERPEPYRVKAIGKLA